MKVPVSMVPASGSGAAIAAFIAIALIVYMVNQRAIAQAPNNTQR